MVKKAATLFCFLLIGMAGCAEDRELIPNLEISRAIEAVVVLSDNGIDAERVKGSGRAEKYSVVVSAPDYQRALKVLHEYGLDRPAEESLDSVSRPHNFTPASPELSKFRLDYALALNAERMLKPLPGVVEARVSVRANLQEEGISSDSPSTASVVIRYRSTSGALPFTLQEVKDLVAQTVPRLQSDSVYVETIRVMLPGGDGLFSSGDSIEPSKASQSVLGFRVPDSEKKKALRNIVVCLILFCVCGAIIGFVIGSQRARKKLMKKAVRQPSENRGKNFFLEASYREGEAARLSGGKEVPRGPKPN